MTLGRGLGFAVVGYLALAVTASLQALSPWHVPTPEIMLLLVLYLGLDGRGGTVSAVAWALVFGYFADLFAGAPKGLYALTLAVTMLVARGASSRLLLATRWHEAAVAAMATAGHAFLLLGLASPLYSDGAMAAARLIPGAALASALVAPFWFALLRRVDRRLAPDPRALRLA